MGGEKMHTKFWWGNLLESSIWYIEKEMEGYRSNALDNLKFLPLGDINGAINRIAGRDTNAWIS
jgi:hypothetical protein